VEGIKLNICMGVGADGFATGYSTSKRKMSFSNFKSSFGRSFPKFYSHNLIGDFLSETDLNKIRDNNLIQMIEDDPLSDESRHVRVWRKVFEDFLNKYNL
jgi:hypothetical protein